MKLRQLLETIDVIERLGDLEKEILHISQDSRDQDFKNGLYFAIKGTQTDGHQFIDSAIDKGAVAIVCGVLPTNIQPNVTYLRVENVGHVMGRIAGNFYRNPSRELNIIAVTGTNGKTSIVSYSADALNSLGYKTLLLSTAGDYFDGKKIILNRKATSSLEVIELHKTLREYVNKGVDYCCLEATSHALDQGRLAGIDIDVGIFTNLSQDHLDYHKNLEAYAHAKSLLFSSLKPSAIAITNYDDHYGKEIVAHTSTKIISYGKENSSYDYSFKINETDSKGTSVSINNHESKLPIIGEFNMYNITAVFALLSELAFSSEQIISSFNHIKGVPGRMELVANTQNIFALVDYAHSSDALENVLNTLKKIPHGNIITVVGCGGDRDRGKRPVMAGITQNLSGIAIYTSDNPRTESLQQIFDDMEEGVDVEKNNYYFIDSREDAIQKAVEIAQSGDIVVVAGKGHEDYQIIGTEKNHFDDREMLTKYLI